MTDWPDRGWNWNDQLDAYIYVICSTQEPDTEGPHVWAQREPVELRVYRDEDGLSYVEEEPLHFDYVDFPPPEKLWFYKEMEEELERMDRELADAESRIEALERELQAQNRPTTPQNSYRPSGYESDYAGSRYGGGTLGPTATGAAREHEIWAAARRLVQEKGE